MSTAYQHWTFTPAEDVQEGDDLESGTAVADPEADRSGGSSAAVSLEA